MNAIIKATGLAALMLFVCAANVQAGVVWYVTQETQGQQWSHLWSIDTATNAISDRGLVHGQRYITDIAFDADGTLYGVGWNNLQHNGSSKLYTLVAGDADTNAEWAIETVKSSAMQRTVSGGAMLDGTLYISSLTGKFQKLDYDGGHNRWEVDETGNMGGCLDGDDVAFSGDGQSLYIALGGGFIGTVDFDEHSKDFGEVQVIGHSGYGAITGLAWTDGRLYGATLNGDGLSSLVKINTQTGHAFDAVALNGSAWGATSYNAAVPEPTMMVLLAVGGVLVALRQRRMACELRRA